jgi:2-polyprenyl-3-methyl-5-hydroxy-6-metoxy-1,4-benzoquinol methylase
MPKNESVILIELIMDQIRQQTRSKGKNKIINPSPLETGDQSKGVPTMTQEEFRYKSNESWNIGNRPFTSHRPVIGRFIVLYKKILYKLIKIPLCNVLEDQRTFNLYLTQTINAINIQQLLERTDFLFTQLDKKIETIAVKSQATITKQQLFDETLVNIRNLLQEEQTRVTQLDNTLVNISNLLQEEQTRTTQLDDSVKQLLTKSNEEREGLDSHTYNLFNAKFRDTIETIKKRQTIYLDYFKQRKNVADLGCGRGEFLDLLREHHIPAVGIDINQEMIEAASQRGLNVHKSNLLDFLAKSPDDFFDGIFSAQVIEHLTLPDTRRMLGLIHQKLQPDAYVVIETLNPLSYYSYSRNFLLDLTHQRAFHPQAIKFLMECNGFRDIEIKFTSVVPSDEMMEGIAIPQELKPDQTEAWKKVNISMNRLNELFFGWQEYAIIAKK